MVRLALDPAKSAVEAAEALYKQVWGWGAGRRQRQRVPLGQRIAASTQRARPLGPALCHRLHRPSPPPQVQARKQRRAAEQVAPLLEAAARELAYLAEVRWRPWPARLARPPPPARLRLR
jgi:hypothetical protein